MEEERERLRWGVQRRLEFIDFRLFWDGRFNRSDLAATFAISAQQASADIGQYEKIAHANLRYDRAEKAYIRTADFAPAFSSRVQLGNTAHISRPGVYRSATLHAGTLELAQKAVALDPLDSRAQLALGWALAYNHRWEHALLNFELARDLTEDDVGAPDEDPRIP